MASLTGQLVAETYKALLKVIDNDVLTASEKQITDGFGGGSNVFIDSNGFLRANKYKVTNGLATQFLKADGSLDANTYLTSITSAQVTTALGYTPVTDQRTLTINGVTYNLTANRSWTVEGTAAVWGNITGTLSNQTDLQAALNAKYNVPAGTISQYIRGDGTLATFPTLPGGLPTGGAAGQILAKIDATDYNTHWIDNYATQTKNEVKLGATLAKGAAVYVSSANGTNMIVSAASNTAESLSSKTFGLLETGGVTNDLVKCVTFGLLAGLDTSAAQAGDPVWLGVNGALLFGVANKPVAPANMVYIGVVTRVQQNNGEIFVNIQNGFEIEELHDVLIQSKANNQGLFYESSTGLWKNKSIATVLGYTPQAQLSGTGFVKASGTTITYDNSTYLTTTDAASTYLALTGGTLSGNLTISSANPKLLLTDTDNNPDYSIQNYNGTFKISDETNSADRFLIYSTGIGYYNGDFKANKLYVEGGLSTQFIKADGTLDSNTYLTSASLDGYLAKSGGTMTGDLNFYTLKTTRVGGNAYIRGSWQGTYWGIGAAATGHTIIIDQVDFSTGAYESITDVNLMLGTRTVVHSGNVATYALPISGGTVTGSITATSFVKSGGTSSQFLMADGSVTTLSSPVTGSGSAGYVPKWTTAANIGSSNIYDDGTSIGIAYSTPNKGNYGRTLTGAAFGSASFGFEAVGGTTTNGGLVGGLSFILSQNDSSRIVGAAIQSYLVGTTATNYGSSLRFYAKPDGGSLAEVMAMSSAGLRVYGTLISDGNATFSARATFQSAIDSRPQLPGGFIGIDTGDSNFDIWGISREFYPSNPTTANAWGIRWNGTNNDLEFVGAGTNRVIIDLDNGAITGSSFVKSGGTGSQYLMADGSVTTLSGLVTGTGTANRLTKFTGTSSVGNSLLYDDGTNIGINGFAANWGAGTEGVYQTKNASVYGYSNYEAGLVANAYYNSGWYRIASPAASMIILNSNITFRVTGTGTAGSAITWTDAFNINPSGEGQFISSVSARSPINGPGLSTPAFIGKNEFLSTGTLAGFFWENRSGGVTSGSNWYGWYTTGGEIKLWNGSTNILSIVGTSGITSFTGDVYVGTNSSSYSSSGRGLFVANGTSNALFGWSVAGVSKGYLYHNGTSAFLENSNSGGNFNIYQVGAGQITLNTNGLQRVTITSGGSVLVNGTTDLWVGSTNRGVVHVNGEVDAIYGLTIGGTNAGYMYHSGSALFINQTRASSSMSFTNEANSFMTFGTNNAERMRITSDGVIQVSTIATVPTYNNSIYSYSGNGYMYIQGGTTGLGLAGSGNRNNAVYINSTDNIIAFHTNNAGERMRITSGGNVLIGTSFAPAGNGLGIAIYKNDYPRITFRNSTTGDQASGGFQFYLNGNDFYQECPANTIFANGGSERMRITSNGNFGFGTSTMTYKFNFDGGSMYIPGGQSGASSAAYTSWNQLVFADQFNDVARGPNKIVTYGRGTGWVAGIGIHNDTQAYYAGGTHKFYKFDGTTATLNMSIDGSGNVSATAFFESSDFRLKTLLDNNPIINGIENLQAKLYEKNGKIELGYFAQDAELIMPYAVTKNEDGFLNLSYREIHTAKIARLEQRVAELEKQLNLN